MIERLLDFRVASFDLSTRQTGVWYSHKKKHETLKAANKKEWFLHFTELMPDIDIAIIEGFAFKGNRVTQIAELVGIFKLAAEMYLTEVITVPILTWKSAHALQGIKKDRHYVKAINGQYGIDAKNPDEADAWLIWHTAIFADELNNTRVIKEIMEAVK